MDTIKALTLKDKLWRKYALKICGCTTLADDLVQDTYLKLYNYNKELSNGYVYFAIRSVYLDHLRKQVKCISLEDLDKDIQYQEVETYDLENEVLTKLKQFDEYYAELTLINADGKSLRKIAKQYHKHYLQIYYKIKEIKDEIKKDSKLKSLYLSINP